MSSQGQKIKFLTHIKVCESLIPFPLQISTAPNISEKCYSDVNDFIAGFELYKKYIDHKCDQMYAAGEKSLLHWIRREFCMNVFNHVFKQAPYATSRWGSVFVELGANADVPDDESPFIFSRDGQNFITPPKEICSVATLKLLEFLRGLIVCFIYFSR